MLTVIAIDPGVTSGVAIGTIDTEKGLMRVSSESIRMNEKGLHDRLTVLEPDIIIYEMFEYRNRARAGLVLFSRNLIGVIQLYCGQHPNVEVYKQMPGGIINTYYTNAKLKEHNIYRSGKDSIHANEAMMHLLYWYTFRAGYKYNKEGFVAE